jgi:hypothetical protein
MPCLSHKFRDFACFVPVNWPTQVHGFSSELLSQMNSLSVYNALYTVITVNTVLSLLDN